MIAKAKINYFEYSKNILVSILFISPFIFLYEFICFFYFKNSSFQIRNSADIIIRNIFNNFGSYAEAIYSLSLLSSIMFLYFINKDKKQLDIQFSYLVLMFFEGCIFGFILLLILNDLNFTLISTNVYQTNLLLNLYLSIGAGIWEEILFRVILFSLLIKIFSLILKDNNLIIIILSIIISSIIFSLFHYIGQGADQIDLNSFIIRFIGGLLLCSLYYFRGFGVSVIAHISYDFILVSLPVIY